MKLDSYQLINPKQGNTLVQREQPTIKIANRAYTCKNSKKPTYTASFTLRPKAIEHLKVDLGDKVGLWRCTEGERVFYCLSYLPPDFPHQSHFLGWHNKSQMKFSSTQMYNIFPDGEYILGEGFEQIIEIEGQTNLLLWHEIKPLQ